MKPSKVWKKATIYSVKVWASAVIISPIFWAFAETLLSQRWTSILSFSGFYFSAVIFGSILSLPALGIFCVANKWVFSASSSEVNIQISSSLIAILINGLTFALFFGQDDPITWKNLLKIPGSYTIGLLIGIWFFKVDSQP